MSDRDLQAPWIGRGQEEAKVFCYCDYCGDAIYEGEDYYEIDGCAIHSDCIHHFSKTAGLSYD